MNMISPPPPPSSSPLSSSTSPRPSPSSTNRARKSLSSTSSSSSSSSSPSSSSSLSLGMSNDSSSRLASTAPLTTSHRYKRPIKPALKNGNSSNAAMSLSMSTPSPTASASTTASTTTSTSTSTSPIHAQKRSCTFTTPSPSPSPCSSSFTRRHQNKIQNLRCNDHHRGRNGNGSGDDYDDDDDEETWRKDGKEYRSKLLKDDDATGGSEFVINRQCKLKNYCAIADRVQDQFQTTYEAGDKLEEAYIMGNRLIKFLSEVLPTHHHYYSKHPEFTKLRIKTQNDLLKVRNQMEDIAYSFDKEVYKSIMEMQGLEYDLSPGRSRYGKKGASRRPRRKKKVTFALEVEEGRSRTGASGNTSTSTNNDEDDKINNRDYLGDYNKYHTNGNRKSYGENQVVPKLKGPTYAAPKTPRPGTGTSSTNKRLSQKQKHNSKKRLDFDLEFDLDPDPTSATASTSASATPSAAAFDLSLWENRDPDMDIIDMSVSSCENINSSHDQSIDQSLDLGHDDNDDYNDNDDDNNQDQSSSFDVSYSSLEAATPSSFQDQIDDQKKKKKDDINAVDMNMYNKQPRDFGGDMNVFDSINGGGSGGADDNDGDGWESFQGSSSSDFMWPDMQSFQSSDNQFGGTAGEEESMSVPVHSSVHQPPKKQDDNHDDNDDDEESERSSDFESIGDDLLLDSDLDISIELPFVEKIARENIYRGINALGEEEEDSDAADSWEQNGDDDKNDDTNKEGMIDENVQTADLSLGSAISMEASISVIGDVQPEEEGDQQEEEKQNISNTDEHLLALHQEFMSSYEFNEDDNHSEDSDDGEHNEFVRDMTESEFPDEISPCDSSGADKTVYTIATAETEAMTADDDSEGSKSDANEDEEAIIGISRRDSYYPSFDSPQRSEKSTNSHDKTVLPIKLDYLEYKVKDLQVKQENSRVKTTETGTAPAPDEDNEIRSTRKCAGSVDLKPRMLMKPSYPIQMARVESKEISSHSSSTGEDLHKAPQPQSTPAKTLKSEERGFSSESARPHPTAARIKNLKKTAAWKRRFGRQ